MRTPVRGIRKFRIPATRRSPNPIEFDGIRIEASHEDEPIWFSQQLMSELYDVDVRTINELLRHMFSSDELEEAATIRSFRIVQIEGLGRMDRGGRIT